MSCWALIPIKAGPEVKSRLSGALDREERQRLVRAMLTHVVSAAEAASHIERVCLIGPSRHGLDDDLPLLGDRGKGLNPALHDALACLEGDGPSRVVVIAADLPLVTAQELDLLAMPPEGTVAIAPDRHGVGTNALSLPLPAAQGFGFAFGEDSYARHRAEAERLGLALETVLSHGLERDIDEPADLPDASGALGGSG